jgi:hypothetical protein
VAPWDVLLVSTAAHAARHRRVASSAILRGRGGSRLQTGVLVDGSGFAARRMGTIRISGKAEMADETSDRKQCPKDIPVGERMSHVATAASEAQQLKGSGQGETEKGSQYRVDPAEVERLIESWPEAPQTAARQMLERTASQRDDADEAVVVPQRPVEADAAHQRRDRAQLPDAAHRLPHAVHRLPRAR